MKLKLIIGLAVTILLLSCNKDEKILSALSDFNNSMEEKGYHFGDKLQIPEEITKNAESIMISFGDRQTSNLVIDPTFFNLGDNDVTFIIKTKGGETLNQDATINVFAKNQEKQLSYEILAEYPHNQDYFTEGFTMEGNMIYESVGLTNTSKIVKYTLGKVTPLVLARQQADIFSEGCAVAGDKIYQLTYQNGKGFVYDKNTLSLLSEFSLPTVFKEGWGLTYDGKNLIATDGSNKLYFLDVNNPSQIIKTISVAGSSEVYDQLNELEFHNGYLYSNVWYKPFVLKIDPSNGEVVGKFDFTKITAENSQNNNEHVLNGIAFKGENMLVTGKNWPKIYEVAIK